MERHRVAGMTETIVILSLAVLPMTDSALNRDEIARRAGCSSVARITIADDPGRGFTVIVSCVVLAVPIAEILRTETWEAARQVPASCPPLGICGRTGP